MTPILIISVLAAVTAGLASLFLFGWRKEQRARRAAEQARDGLEASIQAVQAELLKYEPIKNIDEEAAKRRNELEVEMGTLQKRAADLRQSIEAEAARHRQELEQEAASLKQRVGESQKQLAAIEEQLRGYELRLELEEMGFYQPKFEFEDVQQYADALELVREAQKELIRQKRVTVQLAVASHETPNLKGVGRLAVTAFNGDARDIIDGVSFNNFEASKEKLRTSFDKINSLLAGFNMAISPTYLELKVKEMALAFDYAEADHKSREEQAHLKETIREEEDSRAEAERAREKAMEEERRYQAALEEARAQLATKSADERASYEQKIRDLETKLGEATADRERATSMAQITKKGHVYIISNIGSFGENVLKIGLTRRLDPTDRVRELGDAAVPFGFDIHAFIYAEDAPAVENALHTHFDQKRMNKVNPRKEFFRISIDEIAEACEQLGYSKVKLTKLAEAREFRATQSMEAKGSAK